MAELANVCLSLPNRPENVLVVRQALTGVAESLGLDAIASNDLNTAATEACNNVVMHAYGGAEGPLELSVYIDASAIKVVVSDRGSGMAPREGDDEELHAGIGLPVIHALSRHVEISDRPGGGTEVSMEFAAPKDAALEPLEGGTPAPRGPDEGETAASQPAGRETASGQPAEEERANTNTVAMSLAPTALARQVLPRVLCALAARAYFSTDRISDVQLVADVLAANAGESITGSHLDVGVTVAPRNLELRLGPLRVGRGESVIKTAADGMTPVIERLTDEHHRVQRADSAETLELKLVEHR
jgi:serine/threonine-protein kinase RsbW